MAGRDPRGPRGPHLVTVLLLAAVRPVGAQDTMTHAQLEAVRSRYPRAAQWEIRVRAGTRLDSLRRLYERRLHRIAAATDVEDQSPYPLWYRAYLRERFPTLPTSGRYQYPRVTAQMLTWMGSHQDLSVPPSRPPGGSGGPGPARVAMVSGNVDVSNLSERHSESSVAVDYHAPRYLIAASNNITGSGRLKVFFSSDGGGSWNSTELPLDEGAAFHSDPAVAWAPDGTAWAATLGIDIAGVVKVQMYRSTDRGATWSFVRTVSTGGANDKELMWIDTDDASLHKGNIYVAWDEVGSGMRFARSTDSGATWSPVATLSSDAAIGADLTTGPSGELYVAWPDVTAREIKVRKSTDGGATFGPVQRIAMTNDQYEVSIPAMCRRNVLIYVVIGVDRSSGPRRGSVYAAWDDRDGAGADPGCTLARDSRDHPLQPSRDRSVQSLDGCGSRQRRHPRHLLRHAERREPQGRPIVLCPLERRGCDVGRRDPGRHGSHGRDRPGGGPGEPIRRLQRLSRVSRRGAPDVDRPARRSSRRKGADLHRPDQCGRFSSSTSAARRVDRPAAAQRGARSGPDGDGACDTHPGWRTGRWGRGVVRNSEPEHRFRVARLRADQRGRRGRSDGNGAKPR